MFRPAAALTHASDDVDDTDIEDEAPPAVPTGGPGEETRAREEKRRE